MAARPSARGELARRPPRSERTTHVSPTPGRLPDSPQCGKGPFAFGGASRPPEYGTRFGGEQQQISPAGHSVETPWQKTLVCLSKNHTMVASRPGTTGPGLRRYTTLTGTTASIRRARRPPTPTPRSRRPVPARWRPARTRSWRQRPGSQGPQSRRGRQCPCHDGHLGQRRQAQRGPGHPGLLRRGRAGWPGFLRDLIGRAVITEIGPGEIDVPRET